MNLSRFVSVWAEQRPQAQAIHFEGEDVAALTDSLKQISAGQMKHKKALKLSDAEAADLAAFMASGGK